MKMLGIRSFKQRDNKVDFRFSVMSHLMKINTHNVNKQVIGLVPEQRYSLTFGVLLHFNATAPLF